ncbi:MAG: sensor histidine kinase [Actinomycetota bacterium]|nr:sensor histidine kinase [Actinomycetota bacterium]
MNVTNKKSGEEFTRDELELLTSFAEHVAIVLQRNVLLSELEENRSIQERLTKKIIDAQEEERKRIALAIHDSVVQLIASTLLRLDACEAHLSGNDRARAELYKAKEVLDDSLGEMRGLISDLRPVLLDDLGLIPALRKTAEEWGKEMGITTEITLEGPHPDLPKSAETALFRIVQEALANVKNHAKATRMDLKITSADGRLEIKVKDNGVGFDFEKIIAKSLTSKNIGFESMQERAKMCEGSLEINSAPGKGTEVKVVVPL